MSESSLIPTLRAMLQRRAQLVSELNRLDQELAECRSYLAEFETTDTPAVVVSEPRERRQWPREPSNRTGVCERCGKSFTPAAGASGRFCSQQCYGGGISIEDRRAAIVKALESRPMFAAELHALPTLSVVSNGTIHNDLGFLRRHGRVESCDAGWRLTNGAVETAVEDSSDDPFVQVATQT